MSFSVFLPECINNIFVLINDIPIYLATTDAEFGLAAGVTSRFGPSGGANQLADMVPSRGFGPMREENYNHNQHFLTVTEIGHVKRQDWVNGLTISDESSKPQYVKNINVNIQSNCPSKQ